MTDLASAPAPAPDASDHVLGAGADVILYLDLACPHCATTWLEARRLPLRLCVRHFPIASKRPRSPALHAAAEAAAHQGGEQAFWPFWDSLYEDRGHVDDPHLWRRAEGLGLDLERFEADRRSSGIDERVRRDLHSGIRAGVIGTPAAFTADGPLLGDVRAALTALAEG